MQPHRWLRRIQNQHLPLREHQVSFFLFQSIPSTSTHQFFPTSIKKLIHNHPLTKLQNSGLVLEKVCEYFYYNEKHKNSKDVPDIDVPAELCLELLMAADYLNGELDGFCFFAFISFSPTSLCLGNKARGFILPSSLLGSGMEMLMSLSSVIEVRPKGWKEISSPDKK